MTKQLDDWLLRFKSKSRKEAIMARDALTYYILCNDLSIKPELPDLYEQGQIEIQRGNKDYN